MSPSCLPGSFTMVGWTDGWTDGIVYYSYMYGGVLRNIGAKRVLFCVVLCCTEYCGT